MIEILLTGRKESNQSNKRTNKYYELYILQQKVSVNVSSLATTVNAELFYPY